MVTSMDRYAVESDEGWRDWMFKIPFLAFNEEVEVSPIPPFAGAMARLRIRHREHPDCTVSLYLDTNHNLGYFGPVEGPPTPYWEIYPYAGDTARFGLEDTTNLVQYIHDSIAAQVREKLYAQAQK